MTAPKPTDEERTCQYLRFMGLSYKQVARELNTPSEGHPNGGKWTEAAVRNAVQKCLSYERTKLRLSTAIDHDAKVFDLFEVDKASGTILCTHSGHAKGSADVYSHPDSGKDTAGLLDALEAMRRHNYDEHGLV